MSERIDAAIDYKVDYKVLALRQYRVMIFVDDQNFRNDARSFSDERFGGEYWFNRYSDVETYNALHNYLANPESGRELIDMVVYAGLPPFRVAEKMPEDWQRMRDAKTSFKNKMEDSGILVVLVEGKDKRESFDANIDTVMAIDAMQFSLTVKPDIVVLVTGDQDFAYMAQVLRRQGIRVEVAAFRNVGRALRRSAHDIWDLTTFFESFKR